VTQATIAAPQPLTTGEGPARALVAACAGLPEAEVLAAAHPPMLASVGNPFVVAQVAPGSLVRAAPDPAAFRAALAAWPGAPAPLRLALYLYARTEDPGRVRARMFAPLGGTFEDAATGSAAAPLSALLLSLSGQAQHALDVVQGGEMGRPSLLHTTATRGADGAVRATVGGACVPVLEGEALL
jgi:trans-2,3-dihydro-3-hydroxyanthranilate isomerase